MKFFVIAVTLLITELLSAQQRRELIPVFVQGTAFRNTGWFIGPGITYMLPESRRESLTQYRPTADGLDTVYSGEFSRSGKIGAYLELGRHKFISDRVLLDHIDYGVHFKMLRGRENFAGVTHINGNFAPVTSASSFSESFVGAFFNASNILQVSNKFWVQNSIGVNADFRVIQRRNSGAYYGADWNFPAPILAQLHYKLGFGWKPEPGMYIIPSIETPILTGFPWDNGKSTLQYFVGRDRPIIFSVRIQWLSMASERKCEGQPGQGPEVNREKSGKHGHGDLWGPEAKKMKRKRAKG